MEAQPPKLDNFPDPWVRRFLSHLETDRGASVYTKRNYEHTLMEFCRWHVGERQAPPATSTMNTLPLQQLKL